MSEVPYRRVAFSFRYASVVRRPSVCRLCMTLRNRGRSRVSSKVAQSPKIDSLDQRYIASDSAVLTLCALQTPMLMLFPKISRGIGVANFSWKPEISLKRGKIWSRLISTTNRKGWKMHTRFRVVPKSTTLDDLEWPWRTRFKIHVSFGANHENLHSLLAIERLTYLT